MRASALLLVLALTACGIHTSRHQPVREEGRLITAEEIAKSGARNAWDALRLNGVHLTMYENAKGEPSVLRKRGNSTIVLGNTPWVVMDDVPLSDIKTLQQIPANSIQSIRILNGSAGTAKYGTGAGNGAIVITTRKS